MAAERYDVVVFGASGFVGRLLCEYLAEQFGLAGELSWAAAGRSMAKLEALRAQLGEAAGGLPLIVADAADEASLRSLCSQGRVVVSTVGPYAIYGEALLRACVESGTDYCDLTGEPQWIRRMLDRYEGAARKTGARIVHCCGFDSIPSDLGVFTLQRESMRRFGQPCHRVKMRVRAMRGGISGGTAASMMNLLREAANDPALRRQLRDPYLLCPPGGERARQPEVTGSEFDPDFASWVAPFVMAAINTRVVHRTNALLDHAWGRDFIYDEATLTGKGVRGRLAAVTLSMTLGGLVLAGQMAPTRRLLERFILPASGAGPTPEAQRRGFFDLRFSGTTQAGQTLRVRVRGDRDPGYGSTARMLGQAAVCLAMEVDKQDRPGGFWTPATAFGERLIARLQQHAGLSFEVLEE